MEAEVVCNKIDIILEHTRLAREFSELPINAESPEAYAPIAARKAAIIDRVEELRKVEATWSL